MVHFHLQQFITIGLTHFSTVGAGQDARLQVLTISLTLTTMLSQAF